MTNQVFFLKAKGIFHNEFPSLKQKDSTFVLCRDASGQISFTSNENSGLILDCLLANSYIVNANKKIVKYDKEIAREPFLAAIYSKSNLCFYFPNQCFFSEIEKVVEYNNALQKKALYDKYGKSFNMPNRPILDEIVSGEELLDVHVDWLNTNCAGFSVWHYLAGATRQPIFFGDYQEYMLNLLSNICKKEGVQLNEVDSFANLPTW